MNRDDGITYDSNGDARSFVGRDAVECFAAYTLVSALRIYIKTEGRLRASRFHTPKNMLAAASRYTGNTYNSRKPGELQRAMDDVKVWADTMKAALPKTDSDTGEALP